MKATASTALLLPTEDADFSDNEEVRSFLQRALDRSGLKASHLADRLGVARTTILRPLKGEGAANMGWTLLRRISAATGEPLPATPPGPGFREDAAPAPAAEAERDRALVQLLAPAARNASLWTVKTDALRLAGILPGDRVVLDADLLPPRNGDAVIAQLYDWDSARAVLRLFQAPYLVAASPDPGQHRPITVDGNHVVIKGTIVARFALRR